MTRLKNTCFVVFSTVLLLAGCAQDTDPAAPTTPVAPPANAPTALVYGVTQNLIYEALKSRFKMTIWDETQDIADFDLVVLDGDGFSGQQLSGDDLVREAIQAGVWVLGLDAAEEDKNGMGDLLHASSRGDVSAYLVRQAENVSGRPGSRLIDFVNSDRRAEAVARSVAAYVTEKAIAPQQANIPARALTYLIHHTSDYSGLLPNVNAPAFNGWGCNQGNWSCASAQTATWSVDHYITVLLSASTSPFGDFQHVVVETNGRADPGPLAYNNINSCSPSDNCEIAWIQTRFDASHTIAASSTTDKTLTLEQTSPTTANNTESVTTTSSFSVGFNESQDLYGSYTYSKSDTKTIADWEVNDVSTNAAQWQYASNTVYDGMNTDGFDSGAWEYYFEGVAPKSPNNLSVQNLEYNAKSHWNNNAVSTDTVNIGGTDSAWYTDAFAANINNYVGMDTGNPDSNCTALSCSCIGTCLVHQYMARHNDVQPWNIAVDMSAVIPVPTKSLTFSPNPAVAGQNVTGTLTLSAPTPVPAEVLINAVGQGATPEHDTYSIAANQDTLTFNLSTGAETCEPVSVTIQAFYADGQNEILTLSPPKNCP